MRKILVLTAGALVLCGGTAIAGERNAAPDRTKTYYGQATKLGSGQARSYVTVLKDTDAPGNHKVPISIGLEFPASAFLGLDPHGEEMVIDFPNAVRDTPFQYMLVEWNSHGHPGPMYMVPHFDFHFYIQDNDERLAIRPGPCTELNCDDYAKAVKNLPPQYQPQGYLNVGATAPFMGNHLIDPTSPEFNGQPFTRTFLYGSYDAHLTFYEPMITKAFFETKPNECTALKLPLAYEQSGYYPTKYCIAYDAATQVYRVSLDQFVYRQAQ